MSSLKESLNSFFETYRNKISIKRLISIFKVSSEDYEIFKEAIYELEKEGKIFGYNDDSYMYKPQDFYLKKGVIQKSSKNLFYLNLGNGKIINIPTKNLNGAKENDMVYVNIKKGEKHAKQKIGDVVRIITPPTISDIQTILKGTIKRNHTNNYYYIKIDDKIIYIPDKEMKTAYPGDFVSIQVTNNKMGKVIDILKRKNSEHVFEYKNINGKKRFSPIGTTDFEINLITNETFDIGDRILVDLSLDNTAKFIKKLDNSKGLASYIEALLCDYGFTVDFSDKANKEAKNLSSKISNEELEKRVDLRNLETFTVDGKTAKDLDDAISLEFRDNKYYLYVHIADVTYYVKYMSALFHDAYLKSTSVYPANLVFSMLPKELSNGVCSLNPNEDKLTKTCKIEFDLEGNILDFQVFNSVINSNYKMSYDEVNDILTEKKVANDYIPYVDTLNKMNELSNLLQNKKIERGFLSFQDSTRNFEFDTDGVVESVCDYCRGPAEILIENFMLITNQLITSLAFYYELPFIYRNHEGPSIDQISKLKSNLKGFKNFVNSIKNITNPKMLQKVLLSICNNKSSEEAIYFSRIILKCMNRAYYSVNNVGHYALALDYYGTFTSPIRRFPDLLNHFIIEKIINHDLTDIDSYFEKYKEMCDHCNDMQVIAEKFELHIEDMLLKEYISKYIGETLDATIEFIAHQVLCVKISNNLCGYMELPKSSCISNKAIIDGTTYEVGDKVKVTIDGIKPNSDEIMFSVIEKSKILSKKRKKEIK